MWAVAIFEGKLHEESLVIDLLPELANASAFDGATVRHVMNMEVAHSCTQARLEPTRGIW